MFLKKFISYWEGVENIMGQEENTCKHSHNVLKRLFLQGPYKSELCGKKLI